MSAVIFLDTGPLGVLSSPLNTPTIVQARGWLGELQAAGRQVIVPEITDYELRRELLRAGKKRGIKNLNQLGRRLEYLPVTTDAFRKAAELWASARKQGKPTAPDRDLDADVILAAQALTYGAPPVLIATTNLAHFIPFVPAELWENITP